jgi:fluoride ion exporter CrcB/FEX
LEPLGWLAGRDVAGQRGGVVLLGLLHDVHPPVSTVLAVGGLGAFTTFSSFTSDAVALVGAR